MNKAHFNHFEVCSVYITKPPGVKTEFDELVNVFFPSEIAPTAGMLSEQLITEITALSAEQTVHFTIIHKSI